MILLALMCCYSCCHAYMPHPQEAWGATTHELGSTGAAGAGDSRSGSMHETSFLGAVDDNKAQVEAGVI